MSNTKWSSVDDLAEHDRYRRIAFVSVAISVTSLLASVIVIPIIYSYVGELQSQISNEMGYCRVSP
jgi:hypothetical protein